MINEIINDAKAKMEKSVTAFKTELAKLRAGRAHPSLLEHVKVSYYNVDTPLNQVATIAIENARMLRVTPWEKNMVVPIEKAIQIADLGLHPSTAGMVIRVPLPPLTEERRRELSRVVRDEAEKARVAIRNIRREANNDLKELLKEKEINEDEERRAQTNIQKLTDEQISEVEKIAFQKEADLMAV
ncbi:ribosome recycling factor [Coxiella-like endosymbiont of Rhipicephalus sanguineus]|uniref:ribosome recycling factor n=1 Tax=Coxiella-like endosymbiont of Rhipicephalus sanguineus TaxID=1955402 RepID=UPI00203BEACC|nr:ribosome recycling factor [Coxiella-like endosymbiont of Rhipicephalus sanguineus]MBT8506349.1 ribosome recycling factor [Coxiella-like endosymbiont of Rhipicephalus sanguineus]